MDALFAQTITPGEVLIMDDGSTDNTLSLLGHYLPRVTLFQQPNGGVARARNELARRAQGDLLAFLDHDDVWHPEYLETQSAMFHEQQKAVAFFTGHVNHFGFGPHVWDHECLDARNDVEVIEGFDFLRRYHTDMGTFGSMSLCCIPKRIFCRLGPEPFHPQVPGVDDYYLFHTLMLLGPIVYNSKPLVAYRFTRGAQSTNLLKQVQKAVSALELLGPQFSRHPDARMGKSFHAHFAAQRREYGRVLMGAGQPKQARKQLIMSMTASGHPLSMAKSLAWLFLATVPKRFQPKWPSEWKPLHSAQS